MAKRKVETPVAPSAIIPEVKKTDSMAVIPVPEEMNSHGAVIPNKIITESPSKAIRIHCLDCQGGSRGEVNKCGSTSCVLWPFRFGKNPFSKRGKNAKPADVKKRSDRMKKLWASRKKSAKK